MRCGKIVCFPSQTRVDSAADAVGPQSQPLALASTPSAPVAQPTQVVEARPSATDPQTVVRPERHALWERLFASHPRRELTPPPTPVPVNQTLAATPTSSGPVAQPTQVVEARPSAADPQTVVCPERHALLERLFAYRPSRELPPPPTPVPVNQTLVATPTPSAAPCQANAQPTQRPQNPGLVAQLLKKPATTNPPAATPPSTTTAVAVAPSDWRFQWPGGMPGYPLEDAPHAVVVMPPASPVRQVVNLEPPPPPPVPRQVWTLPSSRVRAGHGHESASGPCQISDVHRDRAVAAGGAKSPHQKWTSRCAAASQV